MSAEQEREDKPEVWEQALRVKALLLAACLLWIDLQIPNDSMHSKTIPSTNVLVSFPVVVIKCPDQNHVREKEFILSHSVLNSFRSA